MNGVIETILSRKSVRKFQGKVVEKEKIELLLKAAMAAPSALNQQPWFFIVVDDRQLLDGMAHALPYAAMLLHAPAAVVVCGDLRKAASGWEQDFWVQDCSAATQNLLLAAESLGLGAVWTSVYPAQDRVKAVRDTLALPAQLVPLNIVPVGYPDGKGMPRDKWKQSNIGHNGTSLF